MPYHAHDPVDTSTVPSTHVAASSAKPRPSRAQVQRPDTRNLDLDQETGTLSRSEHLLTSRLDAGAVIDERYLVEEVIANGSMGWVYRVRHLHLNCLMALKVLDSDQAVLDGKEYRDRFRYEAQTVAAINHPNVIRVSDFGFFGPRAIPYMVMELLEGHDLRSAIDQAALPPSRALDLVEQALAALNIAHQRGIVHKDLKPANLFVTHPNTPQERLIVLDFGVARQNFNDTNAAMTRMGELAGTPEYLAPEYISHQQVTPALDVYAMALVLIELLTGETLVQGATPMARLVVHLQGPIDIPTAIAQSPLGPILRKALDPDPTQRYPDAAAFLTALRRVRATFRDKTPSAPPRRPPAPPAAPARSVARPPAKPSPRATPQRFQDLYRDAVLAARQRDYHGALERFEACQALQSGHTVVARNIKALRRRLHAQEREQA